MILRKTFDTDVIDAWAYAKHKNLPVGLKDIEYHFLAGGKPLPLLKLLAKYANLDVSFKQIAILQLTNQDVSSILKDKYGF